MSGTDIIYFYTDENTGEAYYGVRDLFNAWVAAGRPPINSAGRLYAVQKAAWNNSPAMGGNGSPADNPDQPGSYELGHCRFAALDINATPERVRALSAAGLVRPFPYESWHWRLQNIYNYPIVHSIPSSAGDGSTPFPEDDMTQEQYDNLNKQLGWIVNGLGVGGTSGAFIPAPGDTIRGRIVNIDQQLTGANDFDTLVGPSVAARVVALQNNGALTAEQNNALISTYMAVFAGGGDVGDETVRKQLADLRDRIDLILAKDADPKA